MGGLGVVLRFEGCVWFDPVRAGIYTVSTRSLECFVIGELSMSDGNAQCR